MTPVYQTIYALPGGNCFQACVASILDLPLDAVPHFLKHSTGMWTQENWDAVRKFAEQRNLIAFWVDPETEPECAARLVESGSYYIATGPSQMDPKWGHCVVMRSGEHVHDPSRHGQFLAGPAWLFIGFTSDNRS